MLKYGLYGALTPGISSLHAASVNNPGWQAPMTVLDATEKHIQCICQAQCSTEKEILSFGQATLYKHAWIGQVYLSAVSPAG